MRQRKVISRTTALREIKSVRIHLSDPAVRFFLPVKAHEAGIFKPSKDGAVLLGKVPAGAIEHFLREGALDIVRKTEAGGLYRAVPAQQRVKRLHTAKERRQAAWEKAELMLAQPQQNAVNVKETAIADSPIGWLARRRNANGQPFLTRDEVSAAERLRSDFERSQLAPCVTQNWQRFLTAGVQGADGLSPQERNIDNSADAARERLLAALSALGPGLSDVAFRVCCFLEGIEAIESSMHWSRRSGKVVLKIALQRLAAHYRDLSVRDSAAIEKWLPEENTS